MTEGTPPPAEPGAGPPATPAEALAWRGFALDDVSGRRVGRVRGAYADAESGAGAWLVVGLERRALFGRRRDDGAIVVPIAECAAAAGRVWTAEPERALRAAPTVDPARPLLREHETALCEHFGIGPAVGRHAELATRPPGTVTARPA